MYAYTLWQPWASLVVGGFKPWEFRSKPAPKAIVGQRIVIHAAVRKPQSCEIVELLTGIGPELKAGRLKGDVVEFLREMAAHPERLPLGAGIGTAVLGESVRADRLWPEEFSGDRDRIDRANFALPMMDVERWAPVVPARGFQRFWTWKGATR